MNAPYQSVSNPLAIPALAGWWSAVVGAPGGVVTALAVPVAAVAVALRFRTLTAELLAVVGQTMQPTQASLWLRAR
jgi:hypothetical protein